MRPVHTVDAPESVAIRFDVAGIGSRFIAAFLDHAIVGLFLLLLALILGKSGGFAPGSGGLAVAILVPLGVAAVWCFFVLFEGLGGGQTPGKRVTGIRVIRTGGESIGLTESAIRNLARLVDFLPVAYGLGVAVMFLRRAPRRLGDLAAGTVVVKERRHAAPPSWVTDVAPPAIWEYRDRLDVERLDVEDFRLAREYLGRCRGLAADRRAELAATVAAAVAAHLGFPAPEDPERFLYEVAALERQDVPSPGEGDS